eukprot:GEMP01044476.1.p1 GENE.GEMP01044476.1~~GEMP01044476.1.p1  ORF type:complete len:258 (+),score=54.68 GEMP01044476.1:46-774(+)
MVTLVFLGACCVAASEEAPALNVLEGHKDALYVNVPFSRAILEPLLPDSLMLDSFDDDDSIGWVSIVLDNLVTLDKYIGSPFHVFSPTHCSGWMTKINILVRERPPTNHTSLANSAGYLVTSVDFEAGLAGWMLSTAAQCAQNIPCTLAYYHIPNNSTTNITLAYSSSVRNANDGFYLVVEASNFAPTGWHRVVRASVVCGDSADRGRRGAGIIWERNTGADECIRCSLKRGRRREDDRAYL